MDSSGNLDAFIARLESVRPAARGWSAKCPAHDDRKASLSIAEGDDGRVLVHCHAGCKPAAICAAAGLRVVDLMPASGKLAKLGNPKSNRKSTRETFATARDAVAELERMHRRSSAQWTYDDANGEPVGVVVRWDLADGKKDIRPVSLHADGWRIEGMPEPRPLYNLPELLGAKRVYVVEGEKTAEAARSIGLIATTSVHGCESADKSDWKPLAGKEVIGVPDNDTPGRKYVKAVADIAAKLKPAATVRILDLAQHAHALPKSGDLADVLHDDQWCGLPLGDAATPADLRELLERLATDAPIWEPVPEREPGPILTCLADVEPREVAWLWPARIPLGRITLLVGRPGEGKSFLTIDAAARVTTGTPWPDGSECPKGSVLLISAEDDAADTIRPRLDSHYADVGKVHLLSAVRSADAKGQFERMVTLADLEAIEEALRRVPDCELIVVDPIGSFLGGRTDAHRDNEVRGVLAPIAQLAEKYGPAVLVVAHQRKSTGSFADDLALGSRAFTGIARAVWHLRRDQKDKSRRLLLPGKNNLVRESGGLAYSILGEPPRVSWEREPVAMNADDALAAENASRDRKHGPDVEVLTDATTWLREALADGPRPSKELMDEWHNGQGGSTRTLQRAKKELGVQAFRDKVPGPWLWRLPAGEPKDASTRQEKELGDLGGLAENSEILRAPDPLDSKVAKFQELGDVARERVQVTI